MFHASIHRRRYAALLAIAVTAAASAKNESGIAFVTEYRSVSQSLAASNNCWPDAPANADVLCVSGPEHLPLDVTLSLTSASTSEVTANLSSSDISAQAGVDYEAITRSVSFAANTTEMQVRIRFLDDLMAESDETFTIELQDKSDEERLPLDYIHVTVLDEDRVTMTVRDRTANESEGEILHWIDLSEGVTWPVEFHARTVDGTATAPDDYEPINRRVYHVPDLSENKVLIGIYRAHPIVDDAIDEPAETYRWVVRGLGGVNRSTVEGTMTITDNDPTSTSIALSVEPPQVSEGNGTTTVEVTAALDASARTEDTAVTVSVSGSGNEDAVDFAEIQDFTITIPAGETSGAGSFTLDPEDDAVDESDETVMVGGSSDLNVTGATIVLADDDESSRRILLSASPPRIAEDGGVRTLELVATLDASARTVATTVGVSVSGSGKPDAVGYMLDRAAFDITIAAGETAGVATLKVTPDNDEVDEQDEVLDITGISDLSVTPTTVTLVDDDQTSTKILLSAVPSTVSEGAGATSVEVTARLDAAARTEETTVTVSVAGSGDPNAVDFAAVPVFTIVIAAETTSGIATFTLTPEDDNVGESNQTLTVDGSADLPVTAASVTITDNDVPSDGISLSASPDLVSEDAGAVSVRVTASFNGAARQTASTVTVSVTGSGNPGAVGFEPVPDFTITIAANAASGTSAFELVPVDNGTVDADETLTLSGKSDLPVSSTTVRLTDDDDASTRILLSATPGRVSEGDGPTPVTVTATLDRALRQQPTLVRVSVSGSGDPEASDFAPVPDFSITIPANTASGASTFMLTPEDDETVESDERLTISGQSDLPVTPASVALVDDDEESTRILLFLAVDPPRASEGLDEIRVTVTAALDRGVRSDDTQITVSVTGSGNPDAVDFAPVPDFDIVIPANAPTGTVMFTVVPEDDEIVEADELLTVSGVSDLPVTPATLELLDDDEESERIVLSVADGEADEDAGEIGFAVTLDGPSGSGVTVNYATADPSMGPAAAAGTDYERVSGTLTFVPGDVSRAVRVPLLDDSLDEPDEAFALMLTDLRGATLGRGSALGTIRDDDEPPALSVADASGDEDVGALAFAVALSAASGTRVSASYATADGTAMAGSDYTAAMGTLEFAPGEVSKTILVEILDDSAHEADEETFELTLSGLVNVTAADVSATGTIRDDDLAPPTLAGELPAALLCVGGVPLELELEDYFNGDELRFSAVPSAPAVATAVLEGSRLTVAPVSEGEGSVLVTAANDAGFDESSMRVRVVTDPAELEAVDSALASIGRAVLTSVTGSVQARFAETGAHATQTVSLPAIVDTAVQNRTTGPTMHEQRFGGWDRRGLFEPQDRVGDWLEAMNTSPQRGMVPFSFSLDSGQSTAGPAWSAWARGDMHRFDSDMDGTSHDGSLTAIHLGADARAGDWLAGVSVSRSAAEADYRFDRSVVACGGGGSGEGMIEADLTSAHPYAGRRVGDGWVWAAMGAGSGEVTVERCETGQRRETNLSMRLGALGGRHPVTSSDRIALSIVEEIALLSLATGDAPGPIGDRAVRVGQARLGLEASGVVPAGCECSISSFVRAFARGDWGDGATGAGLELAAGVRFRNLPRRIGIDAGVRALAVHSAEGAGERSASVAFSMLPRSDGSGWQASLAWRQGAVNARFDMVNSIAPWAAPSARLPGAERRWIAESRLGYGIRLRRSFATPFVEFDARLEGGNARLGVRHEYGDRIRGMVFEWRIEPGNPAGQGSGILLEASGRF